MRTRLMDVVDEYRDTEDDLLYGVDYGELFYSQGWEDGYNRRPNIDPGNPQYTDGWWDGRGESEARSEFHGPL